MLPITSNAAKPAAESGAAPADDVAAARGREAAAQFEGLLFASALEPLSRAAGMLGDVLTGAVATEVARASHDELFGRLAALTAAGPQTEAEPETELRR